MKTQNCVVSCPCNMKHGNLNSGTFSKERDTIKYYSLILYDNIKNIAVLHQPQRKQGVSFVHLDEEKAETSHANAK